MALIANEFHLCRFYARTPNGIETTSEAPYFKAELISAKDRSYIAKAPNLFTTQTKFVLRTDAKIDFENLDFKGVRGFIEFQGDIYQIQNISYELSDQSGIGAGRFTKRHTERNAVKLISVL
jgi:hypothetical protein